MEETEGLDWELVSTVPIEQLPYDVKKPTYVCYKFPGKDFQKANFMCELKCRVKAVDPNTGELEDPDDEGDEEDYSVEDVEMCTADFMAKVAVTNFRSTWGMIGESAEKLDKFQLSQYKTIKDAVAAVIDILGMMPCEGTATVPSNTVGHTLFLSGIFLGGIKVVARTMFATSPGSDNDVVLKIAIRSEDPEVSQLVLDCIG